MRNTSWKYIPRCFAGGVDPHFGTREDLRDAHPNSILKYLYKEDTSSSTRPLRTCNLDNY